MRIRFVGAHADGVEARIGQARSRGREAAGDEGRKRARVREIAFTVVVLVAVLVSDISDGKHRLGADLALYADAPLIAGGKLVVVDLQTGDGRRDNGLRRYGAS